MKTTLIALLLAGSVLTGCATTSLTSSGSGFGSAEVGISVPSTWDSDTDGMSAVSHERLDYEWLRAFDETDWALLVDEAYRNNPNLDRLEATLERSNALAEQARSGLLPVLNGLLGGTQSNSLEGSTQTSSSLSASLSASWEPDLWGRLSAGITASELDRDSQQFDLDAAKQLLAASVVETAFLAIEADQLVDVAQRNLDALSETLGFVEVQYDRGLRSAQELVLIRADVATATAALQQAEGASRLAYRSLEVLLGSYPSKGRNLPEQLPDIPKIETVGAPADVLRSRPDLRSAERRVQAAFARHEAALANQKPRLTLGGSLGGSGASLSDVVDPVNMATELLANVTAPLFDGGQRRAAVKVAEADIDEALAVYREAALEAFQEVEDQLDQAQVLRAQEEAFISALKDARDAFKFTWFRYESGDVDLLNVLQIQQRVTFTEAQLVNLQRARLVQFLNLSLALGVPPVEA